MWIPTPTRKLVDQRCQKPSTAAQHHRGLLGAGRDPGYLFREAPSKLACLLFDASVPPLQAGHPQVSPGAVKISHGYLFFEREKQSLTVTYCKLSVPAAVFVSDSFCPVGNCRLFHFFFSLISSFVSSFSQESRQILTVFLDITKLVTCPINYLGGTRLQSYPCSHYIGYSLY